ncbi:MAG: hypothetical protein VST70_10220 [Nitrospirota bacterium]|nr:hypothetical protein [Nitrospirota bacterium]
MFVTITFIRWLHLVGAAALVGGMVLQLFVVSPLLSWVDPAIRGKLAKKATDFYLPVFWVSLSLLIMTGAFVIFDRLVSLENMVFPYKNSYETFWLLKLSFVGGIALLGILIARMSGEIRTTTQKQISSGPDSEKAARLEDRKTRLRQTVGLLRNLNVVLGIFVLLWAAVLQNIFGLLILR